MLSVSPESRYEASFKNSGFNVVIDQNKKNLGDDLPTKIMTDYCLAYDIKLLITQLMRSEYC